MHNKTEIHSFESYFFNSDSGTFIHKSSYVAPTVQLGQNVKIGPSCTILGATIIDDNTRIYGHTMIGMPAEDRNTFTPQGTIVIGRNCHIREFVSINSSKYPTGSTHISDDCYIMNFCYVSHDAFLEQAVTLINGTNLGGHTYIEHHATLMANSATHQFCRIGAYSVLAAYSATSQDIPPFCIMDGIRAKFFGINRVGLTRNNFSKDDCNNIKMITKYFFQDKKNILQLKQAAEANGISTNQYVQKFITFIEQSTRGINQKTVAD